MSRLDSSRRAAAAHFFAWLAAVAVTGSVARAADALAAVDPPDRLQEVIVTASLRRDSAAAAPVSVTVLGRETLREAGVQHLQDVLGLVPNLNWASGSSRPRYFQLRGIGENDQWQGAPNPSVGFLIDGIDFSGVGMAATLFDVEQVEVLRGPQGAIHGANALAGLINVRTHAATPDSEARVEVSGDDYGGRGLGAVVGGAAGADGDAWRVVAQRYAGDGFRRNAFLNRNDTNGYDETTLRGRLALGLGSVWKLDVALLGVDLDNGYDAFALDNSRVTQSDKPGVDRQRSLGTSARVVYSGSSAYAFESVTAWSDSSIEYAFDGDWAFDPGYDFTSRFDRQHETLSQDLRWLSAARAENAGDWSWLAGAYALRVRETNDQLDLYNGDVFRGLQSDYAATNLALYAQIERRLSQRLKLIAAARGEQREVEYRDSDGLAARPRDHMWGGNLSLQYELGHGQLYGTVARGFKAGGFNIGAIVPADRLEFGPEFLLSWEAGWKGRLADARLDVQAALFHMRRSDQQVSTSVQLDPGDPLSFIYLTDNAASGENSGLEFAASWQAVPRLQLGATLGLLRARFLNYRRDAEDLSGREQAHAPSWQYSLSAEYRHPRGWFLRSDLHGVDAFYFSESHPQRSSAYALVNLRAGIERGGWRASLWARNLFDRSWAQRGFYFGNEPPDFPNRLYLQPGDPRQLGMTVSYEWR
jgi:iron complex outermembrane recepter protein